MPIFTIPQKINIGAVSVSHSIVDILKSGLYGGGVDLNLPRKIYCIHKSIKWAYDLDPTDDSLTATTNYMMALCGRYALSANIAISGSIGGSVIVPSTGVPFTYLIPILGSYFTDATNYDDTRIVEKQIAIFFNDISRYLTASEFEMTSTGVNILISGFDAVANPTYELFIYIIF